MISKIQLSVLSIFLVLFTLSNLTYSQSCYFTGNRYERCTDGTMTIADCKVHDGSFLNPYPPHNPIALVLGTHCGNNVGGGNGEFYSLDLENNVLPNQSYRDSGINVIDEKVLYVLYHYEEYNHNAPGHLSSIDEEVAAVQIAIHHFTEGLDLNTMDTTTGSASQIAAHKRIHTRAWYIVNDANANFTPRTVITPIQFIPEVDPDQFRIKIVNMDGGPQSGIVVNLCLSDSNASLNDYSKTTNTNGLTGIFTISGGTNGVIIGATAVQCRLPCGRIFASSSANGAKKLVLTGNVSDNYLRGDFCDRITFGVLPVELASFTANINGRDVTLNWKTLAEDNNSGFEIYRELSGTDIWEKISFVRGHATSNQPHEYSFTDKNLNSGRYSYRIRQVDYNGNFKWYALGSEIGIGTPVKFQLKQNYPNPFNPVTTIDFDIPNDAVASIKIFDLSGKQVAVLLNNIVTAGYHSINFDASNLSSGIYYYKFESAGFIKVMKMAVVK